VASQNRELTGNNRSGAERRKLKRYGKPWGRHVETDNAAKLGVDSIRTHSGRVLKLLTFVLGQCHDDRIFIDAKELGRVVVGIAEY
jgi:hypothetical protein